MEGYNPLTIHKLQNETKNKDKRLEIQSEFLTEIKDEMTKRLAELKTRVSTKSLENMEVVMSIIVKHQCRLSDSQQGENQSMLHSSMASQSAEEDGDLLNQLGSVLKRKVGKISKLSEAIDLECKENNQLFTDLSLIHI